MSFCLCVYAKTSELQADFFIEPEHRSFSCEVGSSCCGTRILFLMLSAGVECFVLSDNPNSVWNCLVGTKRQGSAKEMKFHLPVCPIFHVIELDEVNLFPGL